jgi:glyoxylase-like metal-dependent hydrolase (beta-lactamase superfamily II)
MSVTPGELHALIESGRGPGVLDVRNTDEFARWKIEGSGPFKTLNLPYFAFIDDEASAVARTRAWRSGFTGDLVVVCSKGDSSLYVAEILARSGVPASNLEGGMIEWGRASTVKRVEMSGSYLRTWQVHRFGKGCLSYVVAAGRDALVIDPHRRLEVYRRIAEREGLKLVGVFDTHLHADHESGARELSRSEGIPYYAGPADFEGAAFEFVPVHDRQRLFLGGSVELEFLKAPGHTPGGTLLLADDELLFTGDTLFVGSVGRPDLGGRAREWAEDLHQTLTGRLASLEGRIRVLPAHTSGPAEEHEDGSVSETLSTLRERLTLMQLPRALFVETILNRLAPAPPGYERIRRLNLGLEDASEEERTELELGKNECALARKA